MQSTIKETHKSNTLRSSAVSIPATFSGKIAGKDIEMEKCFYTNTSTENTLVDMWNHQHPLIHTWLLLSFVSIGILYGLFFIIPQ